MSRARSGQSTPWSPSSPHLSPSNVRSKLVPRVPVGRSTRGTSNVVENKSVDCRDGCRWTLGHLTLEWTQRGSAVPCPATTSFCLSCWHDGFTCSGEINPAPLLFLTRCRACTFRQSPCGTTWESRTSASRQRAGARSACSSTAAWWKTGGWRSLPSGRGRCLLSSTHFPRRRLGYLHSCESSCHGVVRGKGGGGWHSCFHGEHFALCTAICHMCSESEPPQRVVSKTRDAEAAAFNASSLFFASLLNGALLSIPMIPSPCPILPDATTRTRAACWIPARTRACWCCCVSAALTCGRVARLMG